MADGVVALALIGGDERLERELVELSSGLGDVAILPEAAADRADALLIADGQRGAALDRVRVELAARPARRVLLIGAPGSIDPAEAMACGARAVLEHPLSVGRLREAIAASGCLDEVPAPIIEVGSGPIVLLGATGGCGVTTCAAAIAAAMAHGALLDLDLAAGDAAAVAGAEIVAGDALLALAHAPGIDARDLLAQLADGPSTRVLPAPALPEQADLVDEGGVSQVLDALRRAGIVAIVDAGSRVGIETLPALERASAIAIVSTPGRTAVGESLASRGCSSGSASPIVRSASSARGCGRTAERRYASCPRPRACHCGPRCTRASSVSRAARAGAPPPARPFARLALVADRGQRRMTLWERAQALAPTTAESGLLPDVAPDVLGPLLADPTVDEVLVNGPEQVWVERRGRLQRAPARFADVEALRDACARLVASAGQAHRRRGSDGRCPARRRLASEHRVAADRPGRAAALAATLRAAWIHARGARRARLARRRRRRAARAPASRHVSTS